jgi:hypothetical protein
LDVEIGLSWWECPARQAGLALPWAPALQKETNHHAAHGFFIFSNPLLKASFHRVLLKTKTPLRGWLFSD